MISDPRGRTAVQCRVIYRDAEAFGWGADPIIRTVQRTEYVQNSRLDFFFLDCIITVSTS